MRMIALIGALILLGVWNAPGEADEMDRLIRDATSGTPQIRLQALQALGNSGDVRAVQPLLAALQDRDTTIRACAIAALQSLVRTLKGVYYTVAQWLEALLANLGVTVAPPPPEVEWTSDVRRI